MASSDNINRGLDEIIADKRSNGSRSRRGGGGLDRRRERPDRQSDYPRDGVKKVNSSLARNPRTLPIRASLLTRHRINSEWVHDRYEDSNYRKGPSPASRRRRESPSYDARGAKLRVENLHYDLTEEDLDELFRRIGPITKLQLRYDRSGRSEGVATVIYEDIEDALEAIKQFDGANANGQPIRLILLSKPPVTRNPFDTAVMPGRPLSERVSNPVRRGRSRSPSPARRYDEEDAARKGIDRYVPGNGARSRSPMPPRRGGRRPGARRDVGPRDAGPRDPEGGRGGRGGGRGGRATPRLKKTQEELDAEMDDYFGGNATATAETAEEPLAAAAAAAAPGAPGAAFQVDDVDMIE